MNTDFLFSLGISITNCHYQNIQTKPVYKRFFERFGTHVATSAIFGGSIKLEDVVITRLLVDPSDDNIRKQTSCVLIVSISTSANKFNF